MKQKSSTIHWLLCYYFLYIQSSRSIPPVLHPHPVPQAVCWPLFSLQTLRWAEVEFHLKQENWGSLCVEEWNLHFFSTARTQNTNTQNKIPREETGGCYPRENTCKQWYLQGLGKNNNWSPDLPQWRPPVYKTNTCMLSFWSGELFRALLLRVNTQGPRDTLI